MNAVFDDLAFRHPLEVDPRTLWGSRMTSRRNSYVGFENDVTQQGGTH